ncbi:MAG TPA: hypothetical protein VHN98_00090 [Acidimicrobiales bacterium]|nr:hypothetical protein [Acidimicrobiales bacterium]
MIGEYERPGRLHAGQARALRRYLLEQVAPYSAWHRGVTVGDDARQALRRLPLTRLADVDDPAALVLRPTATSLATTPESDLRLRFWWAGVRRRQGAFNREVLDPRYKPIHWVEGHGVPIGYSAEDLTRLGELGRSTLEMAGVSPSDVLVGVQPAGPHLTFWQIALGARAAGVSALFLGVAATADEMARLRPSVLCGRLGDLLRLLTEAREAAFSLGALHTLLVVGEPVDPASRARLTLLASHVGADVAVVAVWAPPGVRALWSECRDGIDVHTWPACEVIEIADPDSGDEVAPGGDGEVVWSPLGWKGSVLLRQRTGVFGCLDDTPCVACGRTSPRLRITSPLPPFARFLDDHPDVALWQAELRTVDGVEELIVFLAPRTAGHPGRLVRELDRQLSATQFVVLDRRELSERLERLDDQRVVDLRA